MNICMMHVSTMQIYMILDPDACVYDADMNDAYIHDIPLILMHVCVMHICMILDPDTCIHDA